MHYVLRLLRIPSLPDTRTLLIRMAWMLGACAVILPVFYAGVATREWTWNYTGPIHYQGDIRNAYDWGSFVVNSARAREKKFAGPVSWNAFFHAYRDSYSHADENLPFAQSELNYPPLRLLVMSLWVKHLAPTMPLLMLGQHRAAELCGPLLQFNLAMEVLACLGAFLLVRYWHRECEFPAKTHKPWLLGAVAALLLWFNPAVILVSHGWPQWDVWMVPTFIWTAYLAISNRWMRAGMVLALGAMLKGQVLAGALLLLLFAVFRGRFIGLGKFLIGFVAAATILVSPWLVQGDWAWYRIGFARGVEPRHMSLHAGATYNVAELLEQSWGFDVADDVPALGTDRLLAPLKPVINLINSHPTPQAGAEPRIDPDMFSPTIPLRTLLIRLYTITLAFTALGAACSHYRKRPNLLIALSAPWLFLFVLTAQMHERYLLWFAAISCIMIGDGIGMIALHLLFSVLACFEMLTTMLARNPGFAPQTEQFLNGLNPGMAWAVLALATIVFYRSINEIRPPKFRRLRPVSTPVASTVAADQDPFSSSVSHEIPLPQPTPVLSTSLAMCEEPGMQ